MPTARENWLELRRQGIGSSDIAPILGLSEFRSSLHVWMEKKLNWRSPETPYKRIGLLMEPVITALFEEETHLLTRKLPEGSLYRSKETPWKMATPDLLVLDEEAGVELKNVDRSKARAWGPSHSDIIPMDAFLQINWAMSVLDYHVYYVAAFIGGNEIRTYRFERDDELVGWVTEAALRFKVDHMDTGIPPAASPDATSDYLKARYPQNTGALLPATPEALDWAEKYRKADALIDEHELALGTAENALKLTIGAHEGIEGIATWKKNKDSRVTDWEGVARALFPSKELIEHHTTIKPGARVFRFIHKGD